MALLSLTFFFFFFNDTATTEIYTLSLHDALPISVAVWSGRSRKVAQSAPYCCASAARRVRNSAGAAVMRTSAPAMERVVSDRKSTRLNSSHDQISYAVFCLKKKKKTNNTLNIVRS